MVDAPRWYLAQLLWGSRALPGGDASALLASMASTSMCHASSGRMMSSSSSSHCVFDFFSVSPRGERAGEGSRRGGMSSSSSMARRERLRLSATFMVQVSCVCKSPICRRKDAAARRGKKGQGPAYGFYYMANRPPEGVCVCGCHRDAWAPPGGKML